MNLITEEMKRQKTTTENCQAAGLSGETEEETAKEREAER